MPKTKPKETTEEQFELFQTYVKKWRDELGLRCWNIAFGWLNKEESQETISTMSCDPASMNAVIRMAKIQGELEPFDNKENIDKAALHEVLELFLNDLRLMSEDSCNADYVDRKIHTIVQTISNVIFE
jgi:hypothetical protein